MSHMQVIKRHQITSAQFGRVSLYAVPIAVLANLLCTRHMCPFLVPMAYWFFFLLAPWIPLVLLSVLKGFRYLYSIDMALR